MAVPKQKGANKVAILIWNDTDKQYEAWDGVLNVGDIEIGAVELKDGDSDTRADIVSAADDSTDLEDTNGLVTNAVLNGRISNTAIRPLRIDGATNTLQTISYEHHEIHSGSSYAAHFDNTTTSDDDHRTAIGMVMSATAKWVHLVIEVTASSPAEFFVYEAPTIDNDAGTQATIYNRNRNSGNTSLVTDISASPTANKFETYTEAQIAAANFSGGTVIDHTILAGGEGPKAVGGSGRGSQEWILDQGAKYVFVMQNLGASANQHEIHLDWYEHTDKN